MKVTIYQALDVEETKIIIRCSTVTPELGRLIERIRQTAFSLAGEWEGATHRVPLEKILYIDTVDDRTFLYCVNRTYACGERLYQLEGRLLGASFVRISKNTLLNLNALKSVRPMEGERMEAMLKNDERLIISRHYLPAFKARFGL